MAVVERVVFVVLHVVHHTLAERTCTRVAPGLVQVGVVPVRTACQPSAISLRDVTYMLYAEVLAFGSVGEGCFRRRVDCPAFSS